ncbi:hypothetical protein [Nostoc sp.]|uniref:hypothetical protein n=1 Tax=Nostoc sp. TaxID=1180 RepID=UPI002FF5500E
MGKSKGERGRGGAGSDCRTPANAECWEWQSRNATGTIFRGVGRDVRAIAGGNAATVAAQLWQQLRGKRYSAEG